MKYILKVEIELDIDNQENQEATSREIYEKIAYEIGYSNHISFDNSIIDNDFDVIDFDIE